MNKYLVALIVLLVIVYMVVFATNKQDALTPVNTDTTVYYSNFTVFLWNGEAYLLKLDNAAYPNVGCDAWDDQDENNHNCVIVGATEIKSFIDQYDLPYKVNNSKANYAPIENEVYKGNV